MALSPDLCFGFVGGMLTALLIMLVCLVWDYLRGE